MTGLREQGRGIAGSAAWLRVGKAWSSAQLALSLPLLVGAGLLVRTLVNLQHVDLGYSKDDVVTLRVDAEAAGYDPPRQTSGVRALLARHPRDARAFAWRPTRTTVSSAAGDNGDQIIVEGYTPKGDGDRGSRYDAVGPGYFSTLGVPVLLGREITDAGSSGRARRCASSTRRSRSASSPAATRSACT